MHGGRLRVLGLLFPLAVVVGCTSPDQAPRAQRADVAVPSYAPSLGTPTVCAALAGTTHLDRLPTVIGTLIAQPRDVGAGLELTAVIDELKRVLDAATDQTALRGSLEQLLGALREARDEPLTDAVGTRISSGLDQLGSRAQSLCGFPS